MSGAPPLHVDSPREILPISVWWVVLLGFAIAYVPVYVAAASGIWQDDNHAHGALVLAVVLWLFWTIKADIHLADANPAPALGWLILIFGLCIYVMGRIVGISILEFGSQPLVLTGLLLLLKGTNALRVAWFPIIYTVFMIPLPGIFVDMATGPLKGWISSIVTEGLYLVGYPISRTGVTITIGQYQMLVADACSGLHSMFSLAALGTLYMFILNRKSRLHNGLMLASILPIAFVSNLVRVTFLVLITYHLGDEAGQGFLHGAAGMVLMVVALMGFFALDAVFASLIGKRAPTLSARI
jgi:exosortase B